MDDKVRCSWIGHDSMSVNYHDHEWGRVVHDDILLFENLCLESFQAGITWFEVLRKRNALRLAFDGFDFNKIAMYSETKIASIMADNRVIQNRLKIEAIVNNAWLVLNIIEKYGSFDKFIWEYVDYKPIVGHWNKLKDVPIYTPLSEKIGKDLKRMGFSFVGPIIIYSFMQASGMVNDHLVNCFVYKELMGLG